jgi:hypothetical protein
LDSASNGQDLVVQVGGWSDSFAEPLSPQDHAYIEENGKWSAFDVSQEAEYVPLIGMRVTSVEKWCNSDGALIGATIRIGAHIAALDPNGDELTVSVT